MAKILFIDYWTKGQHQFRPLFERLRRDGHDCVLFHIGSWRDATTPKEQVIDGLVARDISFYNTNDILTALGREGGDTAVLLNTTLLADRIFIRACRHLGIRTAYLMHGVRAFGEQVAPSLRALNERWTWRRRLGKVGKYASIAAQYLWTVSRTGPVDLLRPSTYLNFLELLLSPAKGLESPTPHKDLHCDRALVYSDVYRDLFVQNHGYPPDRVVVVGNPALDSAANLLKDPSRRVSEARRAAGLAENEHFAVYLEDAFVEQGIGGWTEATRVECIDTVAQCTTAAGLKLVVKMHPVANTALVRRHFLDSKDVVVVEQADLPALIAGAETAIGHVSTTLQTAVFLGKPLLIVGWYSSLLAHDAYACLGAAIRCDTPDECRLALRNLEAARARLATTQHTYRLRFLGPADGATWDRTLTIVLTLAMHRATSTASAGMID